MKLYSISDWDSLFETCETRKIKALHWWPKPNKHDGLGFKRLASQRDKVDLYCAWTLIGDIASRTPRPDTGKLLRNGRSLTAAELALMTGFPENIFLRAFEFFTGPEMGWLTATDVLGKAPYGAAADGGSESPAEPISQAACPANPGEPPGTSGGCPAEGRKEGRQEGRKEAAAAPPLAHIPSEAEFIDTFMVDGIPIGYLRKQWIKFNDTGWLDGRGRLKPYQRYVRQWWSEDRPTWEQKTKGNGGGKRELFVSEIKAIKEAKQARINLLRFEHAREEDGQFLWPKEKQKEKSECTTLVREVQELDSKLAGVKV